MHAQGREGRMHGREAVAQRGDVDARRNRRYVWPTEMDAAIDGERQAHGQRTKTYCRDRLEAR